MDNEEMEKLKAENEHLKKKLKFEEEYQEWVQKHRMKGYVAGHLSVCSPSYCIENRWFADVHNTQVQIRKLANNPALAMEARNVLDKATYYIEQYVYYLTKCRELLDTSSQLRHIETRKLLARNKKAGHD